MSCRTLPLENPMDSASWRNSKKTAGLKWHFQTCRYFSTHLKKNGFHYFRQQLELFFFLDGKSLFLFSVLFKDSFQIKRHLFKLGSRFQLGGQMKRHFLVYLWLLNFSHHGSVESWLDIWKVRILLEIQPFSTEPSLWEKRVNSRWFNSWSF